MKESPMGRTYDYDVKMLLADGAAALTANSIGQVASANAIINLGGTGDVRTDLGIVGLTGGRGDFAAVLDIIALTTVTDGAYGLFIMGSNNANGSLPVVLGGQVVGLGSSASFPNGSAAGTDILGTGSTTTPGRRELMFATEQNGIFYQYIYLYVICYGTTSKSIQLSGFVAKLPLE
jgi:hypothetical protein